MRKMNIFAYALGFTVFSVFACFTFRENVILQLLCVLCSLAALISALAALVCLTLNRAYKKIINYLSPLIPLLSIWLGLIAGRELRDVYIRHQIPQLNAFIRKLPLQAKIGDYEWKGVPVSAGKRANGQRVVIFWWGGGFPVKHTVIVYHSDTEENAEEEFRGNWRHGFLLSDHWWVLKD